MNRSHLARLVIAAACTAGVVDAPRAQQALEIILLRHRTVEQVLPALQPLVEPGGTLSGSRGQLFLRASQANAAQIKHALETIDRPARRLRISVRFEDSTQRDTQALGASGAISSRGSRISVTAEESQAGEREQVDQRIQVLEGGRAMIFVAHSRPQGDLVQDMASGFEVSPRLAGDQVVLDILQQQQTPGPRGTVQGQRLATSVTTRLGEWTEVGAAASQAAREGRAIASVRRERSAEARRVWVKVEELPN